MNDIRVIELREALLAVLSPAASMGFDVEFLGYMAADRLLDEQASNRAKAYAAGAVYQLDTCIYRVAEPVDPTLF